MSINSIFRYFVFSDSDLKYTDQTSCVEIYFPISCPHIKLEIQQNSQEVTPKTTHQAIMLLGCQKEQIILTHKKITQNCNLKIKARNLILLDITVGLQITDKNRKSFDNETLRRTVLCYSPLSNCRGAVFWIFLCPLQFIYEMSIPFQ